MTIVMYSYVRQFCLICSVSLLKEQAFADRVYCFCFQAALHKTLESLFPTKYYALYQEGNEWEVIIFKATPHKDRAARFAACLPLMRGIRVALWANRANVLFAPAYLQILGLTEGQFGHIAQILLEIRQYSCVGFVQSDEKFADVIERQSLCGVALHLWNLTHVFCFYSLHGEPKHRAAALGSCHSSLGLSVSSGIYSIMSPG